VLDAGEAGGVLPGRKLGRRWIFLRDELEAGVRDAPARREPRERQQPPAREAQVTRRHAPSGTREQDPPLAQAIQLSLGGAGFEPATSCL